MENASKALIIAGAILISIVLIAVGVMVVNGANGAIDTAVGQMSDSEKTIFNQKFESYEGNQKGSSVKSLLSAIEANNSNDSGATIVEVNILGSTFYAGNQVNTNDAGLSTARANIKNSKTYTVTFTKTSGVITSATITDPNATAKQQ